MSLLDKFIERKKDYILAKDLLTNLSGMNNKPLYEIFNYLLCCDLNKLGFYYIDPSYRIEKVNSDRKDHINDFLEVIKEAIRLGDPKDEALIYSNDDDLENFSRFVRDKIGKVIDFRDNYYFNKTELLGFEPLDGLLHFDANNSPLPPNNNSFIIQMENRIGELLDELADKNDKITQLLSYSAPSKPNSDNRLINELRNKVELQEKQIKDLKAQADKLADNNDLSPKDSAYYLVAIMKELLLDTEITGFYFQSDSDNGKKKPNQTALTRYIRNKNIKDLKTRTIDGIFADANKLLNDARKN